MAASTKTAAPPRSIVNTADDPKKKAALEASTDMVPVAGTVDVAIPTGVLWEAFRHANLWPVWNKCFFSAKNRDLVAGENLRWVFQPIRWWYLYKMPATAKIVEVEPQRKVTWQVTVFPGMYARHTYHMEPLPDGGSRFGSWEQAMGPGFRFFRKFWVAHFTFVKNESLLGAKRLEEIYRRTGSLNEEALRGGAR